MSSPFSCDGYPLPSNLSWWCNTIGIISLNIGTPPSICAPIDGWFFICEYSSSLSFDSFNKILSGIPIFPMSWNNPPIFNVCKSFSSNPNFSPIKTEYAETLSEWPLVYVSLASTVWRKTPIVSKYAASSSSFLSFNSSFILFIVYIWSTDFKPDCTNNNNWSKLSLFSQYPWISSFFKVCNGGAKSLCPVSKIMYRPLSNFLISSTTSSPCIGSIIKSSNNKS